MILTEFSTQIIIAIITGLQIIAVTFMKYNSEKSIKRFVDENKKEHDSIFKTLSKLIDYYNLNVTKEEYVNQMHKNKDFFCCQIKDEEFRNFAMYRSNELITIISHIVDVYDISVNNANEILMALKNSISSVKAEMKLRYKEDFVNKYYEKHDILIDDNIKKMKDIIVDLENHHKDRFLRLANQYLIESIEELYPFEEEAKSNYIGINRETV